MSESMATGGVDDADGSPQHRRHVSPPDYIDDSVALQLSSVDFVLPSNFTWSPDDLFAFNPQELGFYLNESAVSENNSQKCTQDSMECSSDI
jgi:hypothetical protein